MRIPKVGLRAASAVLVVCLFGGHTCADEKQDKALMHALEAGHLQWARDVGMVCTFKIFKQSAKDVKAALSLTADRMRLEATGRVVKLGKAVRVSYQPAREPTKESETGVTAWRDLPLDEVSNEQFQISYEIPTATIPLTQLTVSATRDIEHRDLVAGPAVQNVLTPFNIAGPRFLEPYEIGARDGSHAPRVEIQHPDARHVAVHLTLKGDPWNFEKTVEFLTETNPPVICKVSRLETNDRQRLSNEQVVESDDFVMCTNGMAPRQIHYARGPSRTGTYLAFLFISNDLGDRAPTRDDFTIEVPESVRIAGLKNAEPPDTLRKVNIFDIRPNDLGVASKRPESSATVSTRSIARVRFMVVLNVGLLLAIVGWLVWRRRVRANDATGKTSHDVQR